MKREHTKITYKPYIQGKVSLLPPSLEELIPEKHLVRVVDKAVDGIEMGVLERQYKGGGTSSYHPKMMLKVLIYAYAEKTYSSRRIAKAMRENINFMWLSGQSYPDHRTVNGFRLRLKGVIKEIFGMVIEYLAEEGYVKLEDCFVDGTTIEANANRHKVVWAKSVEKRKAQVQEQVEQLLEEIDKINEAEDKEYGKGDLEELGQEGGADEEKLKNRVEELNRRLKGGDEKGKNGEGEERAERQPKISAEELDQRIEELNHEVMQMEKGEKRAQINKRLKELKQKRLQQLKKYEMQERILGGRGSYSRTDQDATCMRVKEERAHRKPEARPAYNVQTGTEGQFVIGYSIHQNPGDTTCLIPFLSEQAKCLPRMPKNISTDAAYGSEENYHYLEEHGLGNYAQYNTFYQEQHPPRKAEALDKLRFKSENFRYDQERDVFVCPNERELHFEREHKEKTKTGFETTIRSYQCSHCADCPLKAKCTRAEGNRRIEVNFRLRRYREQARQNLCSERGKALCKQRSMDVEPCFGDIKHNMGFRRFLLRGQKKVEIEWGLVCMGHNTRKMSLNEPRWAEK